MLEIKMDDNGGVEIKRTGTVVKILEHIFGLGIVKEEIYEDIKRSMLKPLMEKFPNKTKEELAKEVEKQVEHYMNGFVGTVKNREEKCDVWYEKK